VLLSGQPGSAERVILDRVIMATYHQAGITADPRTWADPRRCSRIWPLRCAPTAPLLR